MATREAASRQQLLRRGVLLAGLTVLWNVVEGIVAVAAGLVANSVALIGFGIDSFIETASAVTVGWRLREELRGGSLEHAERLENRAAKIAGALLLLLAAYIAMDASRRLLGFGAQPAESPIGIALAATSLVIMPLLAWGKMRVADGLQSAALRADAFEAVACLWLSAATLAGLSLNAFFGWTWADPVGGLLLIPLLLREGLEGWQGEDCAGEKSTE